MLERISLSSGYLECYTDETIHHRFCNFHLFENDYYIYPKYLYNVVNTSVISSIIELIKNEFLADKKHDLKNINLIINE